MIFRTVRGRLLFWVLAVTVPIYGTALYMSYHATAERLEANAARDADDLAARLAADVDTVIRPIEGGVRTVAHQLEEVDPPPEQYALRIHGILAAWPEVYGSTIAAEVRAGRAGARPFAPYYYRRGGDLAYSDLALDSYGYAKLPWYRQAADSLKPVWSAPYFDAGGGETWMVTYSVPFFRKDGGERALAGVVTADLALDWVRAAATRVHLPPFTAGWLASPSSAHEFVAPIGSSLPGGLSSVRAAADELLAKGRTFGLIHADSAGAAYLAVRNLETLQWRLMLVVERSKLLAGAREVLQRQLWLGAAGFLLLVAAISFVATGVSRPIRRLAEAVGGAREGDLEFPLPEPRHDETGILTEALRRLRDSLKQHVQLRAQSIAAEARLEHELQIAASIQQSMLPRRESNPLPPGIQVAARLIPARRVGGDLYDYFALRDGRVLFAVGDVSDKGIPAALFMARVSGLIRALGSAGEPPEKILAELNAKLAAGNDACMFVTLGCGVLDPADGRLHYASAGHDAPLLRRANGDIAELPVQNGPAIGIEAVAEYPAADFRLAAGDTLVLYTDGVTEATAAGGQSLGTERLAKLLTGGLPERMVQHVVDSLGSSGFHIDDDLTLMAIGRDPGRWQFHPDLARDGVGRAQGWLREILGAHGVDAARIGEAELVTEELLTNVARAVQGCAVRATVECSLTPRDIALVFRDDAPPFDPLQQPAPGLGGDVESLRVGGLGIHLVRELAASIRYRRENDENVLEVRLNRNMEAA